MKSGWITTGPKVNLFESKFADYFGSEVHAISVNSATSGLHLALEAVGISEGDEVIIPTLTFTATAEIVRYLGANVKIIDINPRTLNINIDSIVNAITNKTRLIIPVHYGGLSCDMDHILQIAEDYNLNVIEDAAHALPAFYKGAKIGTLESAATVFSFYANKTMTTAEGGMVLTKSENLANRMRIMRLHGIDRDAFNRFQSTKPSWYYEVVAPGYKYNMTDIAASIGIHQLDKLEHFSKRRIELARRYNEALSGLPLTLPPYGISEEAHAWHLYVVRLNTTCKVSRNELIEKLYDKRIGTSVHYVPLHRQPYWRNKYDLSDKMFPNAEEAYKSMISLPLYAGMTDQQQEYVIDMLLELLK